MLFDKSQIGVITNNQKKADNDCSAFTSDVMDVFEQLGEVIDSIESLSAMLIVPLDPKIHVEQLKNLLPEKITELKELYEKITGENPWE